MLLKRALPLALALACGPALAQTSQKPIQIIVPFAPGASADGAARIVANDLGPRLGRQVVVENKAGAGGVLGLQQVAKSIPDGDTLGVGATGALLLNPNLPSNPGPDLLRELAPVAKLIDVAIVLVANPATGPKTIREMIERSKTTPGGLAYGSTGTNTSQHLSVELLKQATGANLVHVPYRGSAPAVVDLLAGQIPLASVDLTSAYPHIQSGRLIALGLADSKRFPVTPEIPTIAEGGVPGFGRLRIHRPVRARGNAGAGGQEAVAGGRRHSCLAGRPDHRARLDLGDGLRGRRDLRALPHRRIREMEAGAVVAESVELIHVFRVWHAAEPLPL
jgi:tripartite-type tricarboxylate transporter receptor subunit TctC